MILSLATGPLFGYKFLWRVTNPGITTYFAFIVAWRGTVRQDWDPGNDRSRVILQTASICFGARKRQRRKLNPLLYVVYDFIRMQKRLSGIE
jgi:hypothetical protein